MSTIAKFHRVSAFQYKMDCTGITGRMPIDSIPLPKRATAGSAGYDFVTPVPVTMLPGESFTVPSGIRAEMEPGWVLMLFPRSSLGFRHGIVLANTVGVIDSDYFHADNEGHILIRLTNRGGHTVQLNPGDRICQGVFLPYGLAEEEENLADRTGGIGSTGK